MDKINNNDLNIISGGKREDSESSKDKLKEINNIFPKKKAICADCGKEMEVIDYTKVKWSADAETTMRRDYYSKFCDKCAKKHPYPLDDTIVKQDL